MPAQVIRHEGGNEVVAVVVAFLHPQGERDGRLGAGTFQQFRTELFLQKWVGVSDIDQEFGKSGAVLDQRNRVMLAPRLLVASEIAAKRFYAPRHLRRSTDR